jgi:hypothetical protein
MPRTNQEMTQKEIDAYQAFCTEHRIVCDDSAAASVNGDLIGDYIVFTWKEDITPATLAVALEKLRDRLSFYTLAQANYKRIADEDPERSNTLNRWFQGPGNTSLAKDGEECFQNQTALLTELQGREITPKTIQDAIGRASFKSGLHFTQTPRPVDPRQHVDDGKGFLHDEKNPRYRGGKLNHAYVEPGSKQAATPQLDASESRWREMAENLRGNTHSVNAELAATNGSTWAETFSLRRAILNRNKSLINRMGTA